MLQMDTDKHRLKLTFRQWSIHFLKHLSCSGVVRLKAIPACTDREAGFIRTIMYRLRNAFTFTLRLTQYFRVFSSSNLHVLRLWGKLKHLKKAHTQTPPSCYDRTVFSPPRHFSTLNHPCGILESFMSCFSLSYFWHSALCLTLLWTAQWDLHTRCSVIFQTASQVSAKHQKSTTISSSFPVITFALNINNEIHRHMGNIKSYRSDVAYVCLRIQKNPKTNPELYLKFNYKVSSEHTTVNFTRDYDPNLLLTWCLWTWMIQYY